MRFIGRIWRMFRRPVVAMERPGRMADGELLRLMRSLPEAAPRPWMEIVARIRDEVEISISPTMSREDRADRALLIFMANEIEAQFGRMWRDAKATTDDDEAV